MICIDALESLFCFLKEDISFFQEHQPMPKDNELSDEIINKRVCCQDI